MNELVTYFVFAFIQVAFGKAQFDETTLPPQFAAQSILQDVSTPVISTVGLPTSTTPIPTQPTPVPISPITSTQAPLAQLPTPSNSVSSTPYSNYANVAPAPYLYPNTMPFDSCYLGAQYPPYVNQFPYMSPYAFNPYYQPMGLPQMTYPTQKSQLSVNQTHNVNPQALTIPDQNMPTVISSNGETGSDPNSLPPQVKEFMDMIPGILAMQESQPNSLDEKPSPLHKLPRISPSSLLKKKPKLHQYPQYPNYYQRYGYY